MNSWARWGFAFRPLIGLLFQNTWTLEELKHKYADQLSYDDLKDVNILIIPSTTRVLKRGICGLNPLFSLSVKTIERCVIKLRVRSSNPHTHSVCC